MPLYIKQGDKLVKIPRGIEAKGQKAIDAFLKKGAEIPPASNEPPVEPVPGPSLPDNPTPDED